MDISPPVRPEWYFPSHTAETPDKDRESVGYSGDFSVVVFFLLDDDDDDDVDDDDDDELLS